MREQLNPTFFETSPLSAGNPDPVQRAFQNDDTLKKTFLEGVKKRNDAGFVHFHNNAFGFGDLLPIEMLKLFIIEI